MSAIKLETGYKDEDGDEFVEIENIMIRKVSNGFVVTTIYDDGDELEHVYEEGDLKSLMKDITESLRS